MNKQSLDDAAQLFRYGRAHKLGRAPLQLLIILSKAEVLTMKTASEKMAVSYQCLYHPIERLRMAGLIQIHRCQKTERIAALSLTSDARRDLSQIFTQPQPITA